MIFSGMMLGDNQMAAPTHTYTRLPIGEDMQTMYGPCWSSPSNVVYTGHYGVTPWDNVPVSSGDYGPYEHLRPAQWPGTLGESYRRCCTSMCWIAEALSARLFGVMNIGTIRLF